MLPVVYWCREIWEKPNKFKDRKNNELGSLKSLLTNILQITRLLTGLIVVKLLSFCSVWLPSFLNNYKCSSELSEQARERKKVKTCKPRLADH